MNPSGYPGSPEALLAAPPPPPPPPVVGQVPALRISTSSECGPRRTIQPTDPYEPPAAIQNAMMTKDKKPFTYTPGMGGKLDLSQIRSPRMARRVAKNANDEGIEGPPKSALAQEPRSPSTPQPVYSHPAVAVPVFPQNMPQQPAVNLRNNTVPRSPPVIERTQPEPLARPTIKVETKMQPTINSPDIQTPTPPMSPTQVTLAKAPTPWMQKSVKQQEELPEWAKRSNNRSQDSSSGSESPQQQQQPPPPPRQIVVVNPPRQAPQQQMRPVPRNDNFVPPSIENRPSVFTAMNEPGHHQLINTTPHHQSRWGNPVGMNAPPPLQQSGGGFIIPIQVDGQQFQNNVTSPTNANHNPMQYNSNRNAPRVYVPPNDQQAEPGPVQSKAFRVLQKITDTDADQVDGEQLRKLQLTEDDRCLMNKFKEQVDGDTYLHREEDPRYRGAAIPSRAFRYLQNMTDSGDVSNANSTPRTVNSAIKKQNRNSKNFDEVQIPVHVESSVYVPPSEQQVLEPKKYTGGAIPSRSFRILQAMTAPESIATQVTQENRQDSATDFVSMPGNQQGIYYPAFPNLPPPTPPPVYWNPEAGWWAYYPLPPYPVYDPYQHSYCYYHPQFYSINGNAYVEVGHDPNAMAQFSLDNNYRASELEDSNSDECTLTFHGNPLSRNSALYVGSQWRHDSSTTPTSCATTNTEKSDKNIEDRPLTSSSALSSLPSESDSESEEGEEDEEDSSCSSSKKNDDEEQNASAESSDSSSDSDSYLAYSTGLNPLRAQKDVSLRDDVDDSFKEQNKEDSTDCEKDNLSDDNREEQQEEDNDNNDVDGDNVGNDHNNNIGIGYKDNEEEKASLKDDQDIDETTVCVSLPLRIKFSVSDKNEDITTVIVGDSTIKKNIDTCVDFTLKRPMKEKTTSDAAPIKPIIAVTATDVDTEKRHEITKSKEIPLDSTNKIIEDKRKSLLDVQSHSREEGTDDDDSGVTSDMSRIISEVDTDSECCLPTTIPTNPPVTKKSAIKYQRTQTHSRLFRLLNDEQLRLPSMGSSLSNHEEHSSNSSGLTSPECTTDQSMDYLRSPRHQLPTRPKSLDCEALFKRHQDDQPDSYYQTWKNGERSSSRSPVNGAHYPRVLCPRIRSTKNVVQTLGQKNQQSRMKSQLGPLISSSIIPSPMRTSKRC